MWKDSNFFRVRSFWSRSLRSGHYGRGHLSRKRSLVILVAAITIPVISVVVNFVCILVTNLMLIYDRQIIINY